MSSIIQNVIIVIGLLCVAGLGYFLITQNEMSLGSLGSSSEVNEVDFMSARAFAAQVNLLKQATVDTSVLQDQTFRNLQSYRPIVNPVSVGNQSPF